MAAVCDCFPELKAVTEAREARYRADPGKRAPEGPQSSLEVKITSVGSLNFAERASKMTEKLDY